MFVILRPIIFGAAVYILAALLLRVLLGVLLPFLGGPLFFAIPYLIIVPSFMLAGYFTAKNVHSKFRIRYLQFAFITGFICAIPIPPLSLAKDLPHWYIGILTICGLLSVIGALLYVKKLKQP